MAHGIGHRSSAVFTRSSLPESARAKLPISLSINDLTTSQRQLASGRDVVAIIDGDRTIILAPTGNVAAAILGIREERENQGI